MIKIERLAIFLPFLDQLRMKKVFIVVKSSNNAAGREVWLQEMEQMHSRQFLKLFVLFS